MKIMVISPSTSRSLADGIRRALKRVKDRDTRVVVLHLDEGPPAVESSYDECISVPGTLKMVKRANREGCDAILIACFSDPGLEAAREISDVLVLGIGEVSLHVASMLGAKFTIITPQKERIPAKSRDVHQYMLDQQLASVRSLDMGVLKALENPRRTKARIMEVCHQAAEEDGAEVVVLACSGMAGYAQDLEQELGLVVVDPTTVTLKICEAMVRAGLVHSKRALYATPPLEGRISSAVDWSRMQDEQGSK
jgi:allantoin racemase